MDNVIWNALILIVPMIVGWIVVKYLKGYVENLFREHPEAKHLAQTLYSMVDSYMEEVKKNNPDAKWDDLVDKTIDKIAREIGLNAMIPISEEEFKNHAKKKFLGII